ncbi:MAG: hypothetical protein ACN4A7_00760 [Thermacetogeniaceae bacterium]|jgi:hypothetical protein|nr:hypothetical protein [Thermoanaerobacterales bacterium]NLN20665.1 hypothetical protein [Syntrophomonadaceae bacterium]
MTLKAVDLQVILPKIQDVGRIQQVQQSNEQAQQHSFAAQLLREKEIAQRSVQNSPESKEGRIREKEEKSGTKKNFGQKDAQSGAHHSEQNQEMPTVAPGHLIDLKI